MTARREWIWGDNALEVRIMALPDRKAPYLVVTDDTGMRQVARFLDDQAAVEFARWLDEHLKEP